MIQSYDILHILFQSVAQKGNGMNMLKAGIKRRRTTRQITDELAEEELRQKAIKEKIEKYDELQQKYNLAQQEAATNKNSTTILQNMIDKGFAEIDQSGNVHVKNHVIDQSEMSQNTQQRQIEESIEESSKF